LEYLYRKQSPSQKENKQAHEACWIPLQISEDEPLEQICGLAESPWRLNLDLIRHFWLICFGPSARYAECGIH
jgi:hypothetical protein